MKLTSLVAAMVMCAGVATALAQHEAPAHMPTTTTHTTETPKTAQPATDNAQMQGAREQFQKVAALAPEHIELAKNLTGDWTAVATMRESANGPAMVSNARAKFDPVMGGRYIRQTYIGDVMGIDFKGEGLYTFNKGSKKFEFSWFDSSAPGVMVATGTKNAKGEIVFGGTYDCPITGEKKTGKSVLRFDSKNQMTFEMWTVASDGAEFKALEVVYTRAEPGSATITTNHSNAPTTILAPSTNKPGTPATTTTPTTPTTTTTPKTDPR